MNELHRLAEFAAETRYEDIPPEVVERAKWVLRDTVGVIAAGMQEAEVRALADFACRHHPGGASLIGQVCKTSPAWAVLVHGTSGTTLELDEGHAFARGHAAIHSIPPAVALAEVHDVSGKELIAAVVVGYEVAARAGIATRLHPGVHPFGAWGVIGAAAVGARFAGMDAAGIAGVMEIAASYAITASFETAYQGANVRNTYAGVVNRLGLLAAELYPLGFRGEAGGLQTAFGRILGESFSMDALVDSLGERFEIMRGYFKAYSGCRYTHAAVDAVLGIQAENAVDPEQIEDVLVETYDIAARLVETAPRTPLAGRFSLPHVVAAAIVLQDNGPAAFTEAALHNPRLRSLADRVKVNEDPAFTQMTPAKRPARVTIRMKDGSVYQYEVFGSKGDPDQPMTPDELESKFFSLIGSATWHVNPQFIWNQLGRLEALSSAKTLFVA